MSYSEDFLADPTVSKTKSLMFLHQQSERIPWEWKSHSRNAAPALLPEWLVCRGGRDRSRRDTV